MTPPSDLTSSLSEAITDAFSMLRAKAPRPYTIISGEGHEWFYDLALKGMVRITCGCPVAKVPGHKKDSQGRIVVQTFAGDLIRVPEDRVIKLGFH